MSPPYKLTATQVLELLKNNTLTVETYARSLLDRISEKDDIVKAWAYLDPEFVLKQARALDQTPNSQRGPLHGIAIGIKDIMNTKDMPTQYGSPIYKGYQPSSDSSAVAILRDAGALIFGKTTTTEFTVTNSGPETTNPHDPNRTPGGSSCGSAAAVADLQVTLSLGAQTGGSVIRPASFTGLFAFKPTHSAISLEGQKAFAPTFDTLGFFARSMEDLHLLSDVFALKDDKPPTDIPKEEITVAMINTPMWPFAGPGTISAMKEAASILQNHGIRVEEVSFPSEIANVKVLKRIQKVIMLGEAQVTFVREYRLDKTNLAAEICDIVENTSNCTHEERTQASDTYATMRHTLNDLATNYSAILTPSAVDEAPLGLDNMGSATFNTVWTVGAERIDVESRLETNQPQGFHMPVINIPAFVGANGMPIGLSLVGPRYHDQQLLKTGKVLSEVLMGHGGWKVRI